MMRTSGCFISINVNNIPAVAPRHLIGHLHQVLPEIARHIQVADVAMGDEGTLERVTSTLAKSPPAWVAASAFVWNVDALSEMLRALRKASARTVIVIGGPAADTFCERYPDLFDGAALGAGEAYLEDVCRALLQGGRSELSSRPYWHRCIDASESWPVHLSERRISIPTGYRHGPGMAYVETSRGCPFCCAFCESAASRVGYLPVSFVKDELRFFRSAGVRIINFVDPSFFLRFNRAVTILRECASLGMRSEFEVNLDLLKPEQIEELLTMDGLIFSLGIQSWSERALRRAGRRFHLERLEENLTVLMRARGQGRGLDFYPHLILGLPGDSLESFKEGVRKTLDFRPSSIFVSRLQVLPRTRFGRAPKSFGLTYDPLPPFLVHAADGFDNHDVEAAQSWSNTLAAWDNTYGLQALYGLADFTKVPVSELYESLHEASGKRHWLTSEHQLRVFRHDVEDEIAASLTSGKKVVLRVGDFLRHERIRFQKSHVFAAAHIGDEPRRLRPEDLVILRPETRIAAVRYGYTGGNLSAMEQLPRAMSCIAHGTRIWKIAHDIVCCAFPNGDLRVPTLVADIYSALEEPTARRTMEALLEDLLRHGALTVGTPETT